jgi:hypothetical protein
MLSKLVGVNDTNARKNTSMQLNARKNAWKGVFLGIPSIPIKTAKDEIVIT